MLYTTIAARWLGRAALKRRDVNVNVYIFVAAFIFLAVWAAILVAVLIPVSWLLRTEPGSPVRLVGFLLTGLIVAGSFGCGVYWWILGAQAREREGIPLQIGAVLCWIATFAFGWLFLYGLGRRVQRPK